MDRRRLLIAVGGSLVVSGCAGGCGGSKLTVRVEPGDGPAAATIAYGDLTADEQALIDPAIADGESSECYQDTIPEPTRRFVDRVRNTAVDQTAYLTRSGDSYALYVQLTDKLYSSIPASGATATEG